MVDFKRSAGIAVLLAAALGITGCGETRLEVPDWLCELAGISSSQETEENADMTGGVEAADMYAEAGILQSTAQAQETAKVQETARTQPHTEQPITEGHIELPSSAQLDIPEVYQMPELPTGCESVALTMALMYEGFELDKTTIADDYLVYSVDGDFAGGYVGDPKSPEGAGCFPPTIVETANAYLDDQDSTKKAVDVSGQPMETLFQYVAANRPVLVWTTMYMLDPEYTDEYFEIEGKKYFWYGLEHCVVISGYDIDRGIVTVNDPLDGIVERYIDDFEKLYNDTGKYAVVLM